MKYSETKRGWLILETFVSAERLTKTLYVRAGSIDSRRPMLRASVGRNTRKDVRDNSRSVRVTTSEDQS